MPETLAVPSTRNVIQVADTYLQLLRNRRYLSLTLLLSALTPAFFAFIGSSSDIYIRGFGLSEQTFSYCFAMNALSVMAGSFMCTRLQGKIEAQAILTISFAGTLMGGTTMLAGVLPGIYGFAVPMAAIAFSFGLSRAPSIYMILEQANSDAGVASSFMAFTMFMTAALSMWLVALDWSSKIALIGTLAVASGGGLLAIWLILPKGIYSRG